jgi:hypothetical protein
MNHHPDCLEEMDYGWESEAQRLFALSRMEREPDDSGKINKLVAKGWFVVAHRVAEYCPRTDAPMGESLQFVASYSRREFAEAHAQRLEESEPYTGGDYQVCVLPLQPYREPFVSTVSDDEIPF